MYEAFFALGGVVYGLIFGAIPVTGFNKALILLFPVIGLFPDQYAAIAFVVGAHAAVPVSDAFSAILLGIPGAHSSQATVLDGHPLACQGRAEEALIAAVASSMISGVLFGSLILFSLTWFKAFVSAVTIPWLLALMILGIIGVALISNKGSHVKALLSAAAGVFIGLIGIDDAGEARFTGGWLYLENGFSIIALASGLFVLPVLIQGFSKGGVVCQVDRVKPDQIISALKHVKRCWSDVICGGTVGAVVGMLPGLGGAVTDWFSYGLTKWRHRNETFGNGNIRGVIGTEGSNNATGAGAWVMTALFGIPGTGSMAILIGLLAQIDVDLGSQALLRDRHFFDLLAVTYVLGTIFAGVLCIVLAGKIALLTRVPFRWYSPVLLILTVWANLQWSGGWEDIAVLTIAGILGIYTDRFGYFTPAMIIGFVLGPKILTLTKQTVGLYVF